MTFPFLFGVMFADIGHGFCLLMFGLYLVHQNQQIAKSDSIFKALLPARHMVALMGFCAFYNGWIYNDFLSLAFNTFGSCYKLENEVWSRKPNCVYPIGIDPVWSVSSNELTFVNSYKMKVPTQHYR
jgi:V-type H+-transporting ATPase subunit a